MTDIRSSFPSRYVKAPDLGTSRPTVTIADVTMEEIGEERLPVLWMRGKDKGLVLNRTNSNMIAEIAGSFETDQWRGVRIQLYATKTDFGGKRVDCIRVEAPALPGRPAPLPPMPAPLPPAPSPSGWASTATIADGFLPPALTVATSEPVDDSDIPF